MKVRKFISVPCASKYLCKPHTPKQSFLLIMITIIMDVYTRQYKNTLGDPSENEKYDRQKALRSPSYERSAKYFYPACTKCRLQARHKMQVANERTLRHRSTLLLTPSSFILRSSSKRDTARSLQITWDGSYPSYFASQDLHVVNLTNGYFSVARSNCCTPDVARSPHEKKIFCPE